MCIRDRFTVLFLVLAAAGAAAGYYEYQLRHQFLEYKVSWEKNVDRTEKMCIRDRSGDGRKLEEQFCRAAAGYGWTVSVTEQNPGFYLDKDDNIVGLLTGICKEVYGKEFEPYCMGGGTYARKLPKAVGYGPSLSDQKKPCQEGHGKGHQPDECVCIDNLLNAVEIYVKAILELDKIL